ncbi:MAG TPA: hypothetical protein DIW47_09820 [Bacteroidetes bacterium]|nr:hypothetical protein [Bacteroidota bacterium]
MKFYELIKSNNWLSVELTLLDLYPGQKDLIEEYKNVFEILKIKEPEDVEMNIVLTVYDSEFEDDNDTYIDVSGRNRVKDPDSLADSYALEFTSWKKWLGMDLAPETIMNFSELEIIAHCLYELTFIGFEELEIQEQFDSIKSSMEEYENLTDEEKKANTISLDELIRRLDEDDSG